MPLAGTPAAAARTKSAAVIAGQKAERMAGEARTLEGSAVGQ